jgi:LDH2 family malate/lactate/ureidoglycolate dehydrogenase
MVITFRIDLFVEPSAFKREMDEYVRRVCELTPLPGFDRAFLAGGAEAARERQYRQEGVPVGGDHKQALEDLARDLGIDVPWRS